MVVYLLYGRTPIGFGSSVILRCADDLRCALAESSDQTSLVWMCDFGMRLMEMTFMRHQSFPCLSFVWSFVIRSTQYIGVILICCGWFDL